MRATLESVHQRTGQLLMLGQRLLAAVVLMGMLFCMMSLMILHLLRQPETYLNTRAFMFNYAESNGAEATSLNNIGKAQPTMQAKKPTDPNWDGTLAGASIGFTLGQNIPFIGAIGGPVLGAVIGYNLDSRI